MAIYAKTPLILAAVAFFTTAFSSSSATADLIVESEPSYFVRPVLRVGGEGQLQDGLRQNGPVSATQVQGVSGNSRSTVDLVSGTVKMYSESYAGLQSLQTFGSFGERLTFRGGAGTSWNLGFSVEGFLETFGGGPRLDNVSDPIFYYDVGLVVHRPGQANWSNFNAVENPILTRWNWEQEYIDWESEFDVASASVGVNGSIPLLSDYEQFDVFAYTNVWVTTQQGDGLESFVADFMNTATYDQTVASGVEVFSSSGQFLGLQSQPPSASPVPTPATVSLFGLGLLALGLSRRRRKAA